MARKFDQIEHDLNELCKLANTCRCNAAKSKVMQEAMESEPTKTNIGEGVVKGSPMTEAKR